jgi:hypothetical protein
MLHSSRYFGLAAIATLVACTGAPPSHSQSPNLLPSTQARASSHGSWMDPSAKGQRLLYVSDPQAGSVFVYGASSNKLVGTLTQIVDPLGECVDAKNNVWIVDNDGLAEYAHGGTTMIGSIDMYYLYYGAHPYSCAIDPTTGNLAISIVDRYQGHDAGLILVCSSDTSCAQYEEKDRVYFYFVSYDKNGNLWADGLKQTTGKFWFGMRPPGGQFQKMTLTGATISKPGGLVNADGVFSVGGTGTSGNSIIYQVSTSGTVTGTTQLSGADGCYQFAIQVNTKTQRVTCPNSSGANVTKYDYPAGGNPVVTIKGKFAEPFAAVYSN